MKKFILNTLFYVIISSFQPLLAQKADTVNNQPERQTDRIILESQELDNSYASTWAPLLFQNIPGLTPDFSYRQQGSPLVVLDGTPMPFFDLNELNSPSFINAPNQEVTFLSSTHAIARYGILGQNGAILISKAEQPARKSWHGGAYSGFVYKAKPSKNNVSEGYFLSEQIYLAKSTKNLNALFNYQNQWVSKPTLEVINEFDGSNQIRYVENSPKNWMNHSLKGQVSIPVNKYLSTQISGTYNDTYVNNHWHNLRTSATIKPTDRFSIHMNTGLASAQTHSSFSTLIETIESNYPYGIITKSSNSNSAEIKQSQANQMVFREAGIKLQYQQSITPKLGLTLQTEATFFDQQTDVKWIVERFTNATIDRIDSVKYTFQQQAYRSFSFLEITYNHWINARIGMHGQTTHFIDETIPFQFNPYLSIESRLTSIIGNSAISTFNIGASYSSLSPSALQREHTSTTAFPLTLFTKNSLQARLESGFMDDRYVLQVTFFNEQRTNSEYLTTVPVTNITGYTSIPINTGSLVDDFFGWEVSAKATVLSTADLSWSIGLQSLFLSKKNAIELEDDPNEINVKTGDPYSVTNGKIVLPNSTSLLANDFEAPSNWHKNVGVSSRLRWKGFEILVSGGLQSFETQLYDSPSSYPNSQEIFYVEPVNRWMLNQLSLHYHLPEKLMSGRRIKKAGIGLFAQNVSLNPDDQSFYYDHYKIPGYEKYYGGLWGINLNVHF